MLVMTMTRMKHEDEKSALFKTPKQPTSDPTKLPLTEVKFGMNDANAEPIRWKVLNGKVITAIRVPRAGTRNCFESRRNRRVGLTML
jgi:hypothetical protein